jgi:predicted nucleic acid-binding protein
MILVDTSIWIEFFRGNEPYFTKLKEIIESSDVLALLNFGI